MMDILLMNRLTEENSGGFSGNLLIRQKQRI